MYISRAIFDVLDRSHMYTGISLSVIKPRAKSTHPRGPAAPSPLLPHPPLATSFISTLLVISISSSPSPRLVGSHRQLQEARMAQLLAVQVFLCCY